MQKKIKTKIIKPVKSLYKDDFLEFIKMLWKVLNLPPPTETQLDIANFLQNKGGYDFSSHKVVMAWRGTGKTWITAAYASWRVYNDPQLKVLVVSAGVSHAQRISDFIKKIFEVTPVLKFMVCEPENKKKVKRRNTATSWDVIQAVPSVSPTFYCLGINGQLTGSRANLVIADDIETPVNSSTEAMRNRVISRCSEFNDVLIPGGQIFYLGTPQCSDSIYRSHLNGLNYDIRIWPVNIPNNKILESYTGELGLYVKKLMDSGLPVGSYYDPRFTKSVIESKRVQKTRFNMQYMLSTVGNNPNVCPLKVSDLIVYDCQNDLAPATLQWSNDLEYQLHYENPGFPGDGFFRASAIDQLRIPYSAKIMVIDPAGRGTNRTAWVVIFIAHSRIFLMDAKAEPFEHGYDQECLLTLSSIAKKYNVNSVVVEPNFGDGMFTALFGPVLQTIHQCELIESKPSQVYKEARIISVLEPVFNNHKIVVNESFIAKDMCEEDMAHRLFKQVTHITNKKSCLEFDDLVDALSIAVTHVIEHIGGNDQVLTDRILKKINDEKLDAFYKHGFLRARQRKGSNFLLFEKNISSFSTLGERL